MQYAIETRDLSIFYGPFEAVKDVNLKIEKGKDHRHHRPFGLRQIHAAARLQPHERLRANQPRKRRNSVARHNLYSKEIDPVEVRRRIGMVFQKPNPFPKSIYENIAWGARINGFKGNMDELVEQSLRGAALWDEVKDKLKESAYALSGGQQQRLCIARTIAIQPEIILMDEPASALDPISTLRIEELMQELKTKLHHHHRHPQHAAGRARLRFHRHDDAARRDPLGHGHRIRQDRHHLHPPQRQTDGRLRHRKVDDMSGRFG
jgi:phosphate transport system ATP-binding protein